MREIGLRNASLASRTMFFAQIEPSKRHGWTDLHYCMARNDLEMTKTLLEQRADVNAKTLAPSLNLASFWPLLALLSLPSKSAKRFASR